MPAIVEIRPVREIRTAQEIARRTGGFIVKDGNVPWKIHYQQGAILWAGYPRTPRRYRIHEALPFLEVREPRIFGTSLHVGAAILTPEAVIIVNPSLTSETVAFGYRFAEGKFSRVEMPLKSDPLGVFVWARDLARIESRRFLTTPSA